MEALEHHARDLIEKALVGLTSAEASDAYVVSLFVYDQEDEQRRPTATGGLQH